MTPAGTAPATAPAPAATQAGGGPGGPAVDVLPAAQAAATPAVELPVPQYRATQALRGAGDLESAGESSISGGYLVALAASALAGSALLVVRALRRASVRRR